jgi:hypothetical protein
LTFDSGSSFFDVQELVNLVQSHLASLALISWEIEVLFQKIIAYEALFFFFGIPGE